MKKNLSSEQSKKSLPSRARTSMILAPTFSGQLWLQGWATREVERSAESSGGSRRCGRSGAYRNANVSSNAQDRWAATSPTAEWCSRALDASAHQDLDRAVRSSGTFRIDSHLRLIREMSPSVRAQEARDISEVDFNRIITPDFNAHSAHTLQKKMSELVGGIIGNKGENLNG